MIFMMATSTAQAGLVVKFKKHDSAQTTKRKIQTNLKHVGYICIEGTGKTRAVHCQARRWLKRWWAKISTPPRPSRSSMSIPHYSGWMCIHGYEGSWTDSGDPYWGGLQMDRSFMRAYAPRWLLAKGWANSWTPLEQMYVAERAYSSGRGFGPWPNTARMCGLL